MSALPSDNSGNAGPWRIQAAVALLLTVAVVCIVLAAFVV